MHPLFHPLYIEFCSYFNGNRDYFECHEVLEEYWKEVAPGERSHPLVGYIQIATGMYHWRRGNFNGAKRMLQKGVNILNASSNDSFTEKIELEKLLHDAGGAIRKIELNEPFEPFSLKITDHQLASLVQEHMENTPHQDLEFLLHKHTLRNRDEIINTRLQKLHEKNKKH